MFDAILVLLSLPVTDQCIIRANSLKALSKLLFFLFACNFILLAHIADLQL